MADANSTSPPRRAQFLADSAAFLIRQANLAASPFWESVEIRFDAQPLADETGVLLTARLRSGDRLLARRLFTVAELRDAARLPEGVAAWVEGLPVPG